MQRRREDFRFTMLVRKLLTGVLLLICNAGVHAQVNLTNPSQKSFKTKFADISYFTRFVSFLNADEHSQYSIRLCADVPYNPDPAKVYHKKEPGHVFITLSQVREDSSVTNFSFGFYPQHPTSTIIFKTAKSEIISNQNREYDISVVKNISHQEFRTVLENCVSLANRKYNINRYNCYDYALEIFNSVAGEEKIPFNYVKFPFIAGRGGSPCGLYRDLKRLKESGSMWGPSISIGVSRSPKDSK